MSKKKTTPHENRPDTKRIVIDFDDAMREKFATIGACIIKMLVRECDGPAEACAVLIFTLEELKRIENVQAIEICRFPTDKLQ